MKGSKIILLAQSVMLIAVPAFASEVTVGLEGEPEISTAVSTSLDAIKACFAGGTDAIDLKYKVSLDVNGAGAITAVHPVDGTPTAEQAACVDTALKAATLPALSSAEATASVSIMMVIARAAEQPAVVEPAVAEQTAPVEQTAAPTVEEKIEEQPPVPKIEEVKANDPAATAATSASAATTTDSKPWGVSASLSQSMGQGVFTGPEYASYSYSFVLAGSYRVDPKWLSLGVRLPFDQELTCSYNASGPNCRRFNIRDLSVSASVPELYKDVEYTGIKATAGLSLSFPFSEASRDSEQAFTYGLSVGLSRSFENVGPGTLSLSWTSGIRHYVSPATRFLDSGESDSKVNNCNPINKNDKLECATSLANPRLAVSNGLSISYSFLEKFSASYSFQIANVLATRTGASPDPERLVAGVDYVPSHSPNSNDRRGQTDTTVSTLELSYSVLDQLSVGFGWQTAQSPFIQDGSNSKSLRNPFWDFSEQANNLSTFYLDIAANY